MPEHSSLCDYVDHLRVSVYNVFHHLQHICMLKLYQQADFSLRATGTTTQNQTSSTNISAICVTHHNLLLVAVVIDLDRNLFHCHLLTSVLLHCLEHLAEGPLTEHLAHALHKRTTTSARVQGERTGREMQREVRTYFSPSGPGSRLGPPWPLTRRVPAAICCRASASADMTALCE